MVEPREGSVVEAAQILGCRIGNIYNLLREGLITGRKPKPDSGVSVWYVNVESVENYKLKMVRKKLLKEKI